MLLNLVALDLEQKFRVILYIQLFGSMKKIVFCFLILVEDVNHQKSIKR